MKKDFVKSHLKKKSQSKLALSISLFIVLLTSTGYIFNSKGIIFSKKRIPYFIALITGVILVILLVVFYASNF